MSFIDIFRDGRSLEMIRKVRRFGDKNWKCVTNVMDNEIRLVGEKNILSEDKNKLVGSEKFVISHYPIEDFDRKKGYFAIEYEKDFIGPDKKITKGIYVINNWKDRFNFETMNLFWNRIKQSAPAEKDYSKVPDFED